MSATILWAALIAAAYVLWPIVGKYSGASGAWIGVVVIGASVLGILPFAYRQLAAGPAPTLKALGILVVAGIINGIAVYFYGTKASDPTVQTGVFLTTVYVLMIVLAPVADMAFNHGTISIRQSAGIALALVVVYLLSSK